MFNIVAAELLFGAVLVGVLWLTWPAPPWDLVFRPPTSEEVS
jgi:hypothetical protein